VVDRDGRLACHDFAFDGWGGKYHAAEYTADDAVPRHIARALGIPVRSHEFVLEGGAIDVDGRGAALLSRRCLLEPGRNGGGSRSRVEAILAETLGVQRLIWVPGAITGDDTDGHVDTLARFIGSRRVAIARAPADHPDHDTLEAVRATLREARDAAGEALELLELPAPEPMRFDYPPDRFDAGGRAMLPASYLNFVIVNGAVLVPAFGQPADSAACRALDNAMPAHTVIPVRSEHLIIGRGGPHCLTMHQPRARIEATQGRG